ncbi:MAG TPA: DUF4412 domain-containing protein [Polyangiaceae bacterium]|nr:DUF4412 domain-containing protein [Polyangiaceae bacterium]
MKRIAPLLSIGWLLTSLACKHEDKAPPLAHSASVATPLASAPVLPPVDSSAPSASDFEGEIALLAKGKFAQSEGKPLELKLQIKAGKLRVELPDSLTNARGLGPAYLLVQAQDKKAYAVLESKKQAVLLEFDQLAEQAKVLGARARPAAGKSAPPPPRLERTGKFDTVADTKCEIWHYNQGNSAGDACIAERATPWLQFPIDPAGQAPAELSWVSALADGKHFPLRFVATEKDVERGRIEVIRIQQKSLPASSFELPAGFAVLGLDQMIGSMLGGLPGAGLPPGSKLPPGLKLPPGIKLPPERTAPSNK